MTNESLPSTDRIEAPPHMARLGLIAGPILAVAVFWLLPHGDGGLPHAARACGGVALLMAVWWMTEALPLEATALLPLVLLPLAGVYSENAFKRAAAPFADPAIFLFLGGFLIALAIERWELHRRIALLTLLAVGTSPARLIGGFMLATALISMWISNTATTVMMLPIGLSVVRLLADRLRGTSATPLRLGEGGECSEPGEGGPAAVLRPSNTLTPALSQRERERADDAGNFAVCLLLGIAYAASLGGFATLVGTPPNVFFKGFMHSRGVEIDFWRWMLFATPMSFVYLLLAWLLMTRILFPLGQMSIPGGRQLIRDELARLGPMSRGEWIVLVVFLWTAGLWMAGGWLRDNVASLKVLDDYLIAMIGALALFMIPVDPARHVFALDWKTAVRLPWGVLLLFGGGLSLAQALTDSGLAQWIGQQVAVLRDLPTLIQIVLIVAIIVFSGELTNNLSAVVALLPI